MELLADMRFRIAPLTDRDADELLHEGRVARALQGYRGRPAADLDALKDVVLRASRLAEALPEISRARSQSGDGIRDRERVLHRRRPHQSGDAAAPHVKGDAMASQAMKRIDDAVARAAQRRDEIEMQAMRIEVSDRARSADAPSRLATLARGLGRVGPPRGTISTQSCCRWPRLCSLYLGRRMAVYWTF